MKRDCIFLFLSQLNFGGQERFVSHLDEILRDRYQIYIVLFDASSIGYKISGTILDIGNADFLETRLLYRLKKVVLRCRKLSAYLKKYKPIACISFGIGPNYINLLCKKRGTKVVPSIRGYASAEKLCRKTLAKILYGRADKIVCVSKGIEDKLRREFNFKEGRLVTIYNAYDVDSIFSMSRENHEEISAKMCYPYIVSVGTLRPEKGYWHLIKAVRLLKDVYPDIGVSIVGEDYLDNGKKIKNLLKKLDLERNIFLEGLSMYPYEYMNRADIYVLSSVREGFPNALVEAMACGKPVIASDCMTGPREILYDDGMEKSVEEKGIEIASYGILVCGLNEKENYSGNIDDGDRALAKAIQIMVSDSRLRDHYIHMSMKRARDFSYSECREKYDAIIRGAV